MYLLTNGNLILARGESRAELLVGLSEPKVIIKTIGKEKHVYTRCSWWVAKESKLCQHCYEADSFSDLEILDDYLVMANFLARTGYSLMRLIEY